MERNYPLVSVLVPTFNEEIYVEECIRSILAQDYPNFEIIVFDDCSTDRTVEILETIKDPKLTVIKNPKNEKHDKTWNQLLHMAKGEFIKVICSDDILIQGCLKDSVDALMANPSSIMSFCGKHIIGPDSKVFYSPLASESTFKGKTSYQIMRDGLLAGTNLIGEPNNVLFRATALKHGIQFRFKNYWMVDPDFYIQLAPLGDFTYVPKRLTGFRISLKSWSVLFSYRQARMFKAYVHSDEIMKIFKFSKWELFKANLNALKLQLMRQIYYVVIILKSKLLAK